MNPIDRYRTEVRAFVVQNFLFGVDGNLDDSSSFLEEGILDSTGVLELVAHLEARYRITVEPDELTPDNLDSIGSIASYLMRKHQVPLDEHGAG